MADKKISEATNTQPRGTDKLPIARASSIVAYNVTVADIRHGVLDVHDYGAVGDGTTDDTVAINAALAATNAAEYGATRAGRIIVKGRQDKKYLIASPLNLCEMQNVVLDFDGATLIGQTSGAAMIEVIGSQDMTIQNVNIYGSNTNSPAVGIFTSRSDTVHGVNSYNIGYDNVQIGGYFTQAPIYVVESENNFFRRCSVDTTGGTMTTCALLCRANELALTPVHATMGDHGYGLFNINFDKCTFSPQGDVRAIHMNDAAGSVFLNDCYLYSTTVPTIEIEGGGTLHCSYVSCEGTPEKTIYLNYDAGAYTHYVALRLDNFGFGSPSTHTIYADDLVILHNTYIRASKPGFLVTPMPVRLYITENCDFSGFCEHRTDVFDILFDAAAGYSYMCKYRLGRADTVTFTGGAYSLGDIIEDMSVSAGELLQVPSLRIRTGTSLTAIASATKTWDVDSLDDGESETTFVNGGQIADVRGDGTWIAFASLTSLDEVGWVISALPVSDPAVYVTVTNHSGGTINPPSGTLRVVAIKVA